MARIEHKIIERVVDFQKKTVTITASAWQHVLHNHPDMALEWERVRETVQNPDVVVEQVQGVREWLYHKTYETFPLSTPYLRVAVRWLTKLRSGFVHGGDGFLTSSYRTRGIAKGAVVWQKA